MSVPPRWRHCPRKGKLIDGKFMPFKTPLSVEYDKQLKEEDRFHVPMLISYVEAAQQRMGMVVDLTKTDRYYDKRDLMNHNIGHYKIVCEGYGAPPTDSQVKEFIQVSKKFFSSHYGEIIGIHCTHGFNRTGFLIAAYLIEEECWDLEAAVAVFSRARPPGIYKGHYLQELIARYASDGDVPSLPAPELPDWCLEEEEANSGGEEDSREENGRGARPKRREFTNEQAQFAVNIAGVSVVQSPLREDVQQTCQRMLGWESSGFPGSQPVSMDVQNIKLLHERPYRVSWKADGTRYLLYIRGKGAVYLIDRDNSVFSVPHLTFPARKRPGDHLVETLADSELVQDKVAGGGLRPRLLIYDIMQFEGSKDVGLCDHVRRMLCVRKEIIEPREKAAVEGQIDKTAEPFSVREKTFWDVSESRMILEKFIPQLTHENDGLIFNPTEQKYIIGECKELLKWKPEELNSVDFRLNIVKLNKPGELPRTVGQLFVGGAKQPMSELDLSANREAQKYNGRIVECCWDRTRKKWMFMRLREDKSFPNSYTTAQKVCMSIRQPVTKEWLLEVVERHRWELHNQVNKRPASDNDDPGSTLMPPPKTKPRTLSE